MLESTKKLRKQTICDRGEKYTAYLDAGDIADEIEREVAERFIELPVDADGVPWHIGDTVDDHGKVDAMGLTRHGWHFVGVANAIDPGIHRHANPRTLTDVLADLFDRKMTITDAEHEISELLGGDAS